MFLFASLGAPWFEALCHCEYSPILACATNSYVWKLPDDVAPFVTTFGYCRRWTLVERIGFLGDSLGVYVGSLKEGDTNGGWLVRVWFLLRGSRDLAEKPMMDWLVAFVPNFVYRFMENIGRCSIHAAYPILVGSMYGIFTYTWLIFMAHVGRYTIHGSYGYGDPFILTKYEILDPSRFVDIAWAEWPKLSVF